MNNSFLLGTGECLGYCSIVPKTGEEHRFGERDVRFSYSVAYPGVGPILFFESQVPYDPQIEDSYDYHMPTVEQVQKYYALREKAKELAYLINGACPKSANRTLAHRHLEMAVMWANKSIACDNPKGSE